MFQSPELWGLPLPAPCGRWPWEFACPVSLFSHPLFRGLVGGNETDLQNVEIFKYRRSFQPDTSG